MTVRTEMDRDYLDDCLADRAEYDDEPRALKPRYCHECRCSFGHSPGCPNEPQPEGDKE